MSFGAFPNDPGLGTTFIIAQAAAGAPIAGYWKAGSAIIDANGIVWICTVTGTPGVWVEGASGAAGVTSFNGRSGAVVPANGDYTVGWVTGAAPLASPALTGAPTAPTAAALDNSTKLATTAYTDGAVGVEKTRALAAEALLAPIASPTFTGVPAAPTPATADNSTKVATTAYVKAQPSASPKIASLTATVAVPLNEGVAFQSLSLGANTLSVGQVLRAILHGQVTAGVPSPVFRFRFGPNGTTADALLISYGTTFAIVGGANGNVYIEALFSVLAIGASGSIAGGGFAAQASGGSVGGGAAGVTPGVAVDTTVANFFSLTAATGTPGAAVTLYSGIMELL